ncbi:hypothetical protein B0T10DRAFT_495981 [Thelonectria olida]|uniref:Uncharacterized protein n=1 Tax=Thelonectria olida TaxID=1576542 RepID=A0A9P8VWI9_9HYPO|nr:hypothetical protein B0T10DRAFT_495981 [Thelonectria olida]
MNWKMALARPRVIALPSCIGAAFDHRNAANVALKPEDQGACRGTIQVQNQATGVWCVLSRLPVIHFIRSQSRRVKGDRVLAPFGRCFSGSRLRH